MVDLIIYIPALSVMDKRHNLGVQEVIGCLPGNKRNRRPSMPGRRFM